MAFEPALNPQPVTLSGNPDVNISNDANSPVPVSQLGLDIEGNGLSVFTAGAATLGTTFEVYNVPSATTINVKQIVLRCADPDLFLVQLQTEEGVGETVFASFLCTGDTDLRIDATKVFPGATDDFHCLITRIGAGVADVRLGIVYEIV